MIIYGYMLSVNSDYWLEMAICGELFSFCNCYYWIGIIC
nr:MAG TPA: hypothetical protein [Caudoviricetes sp.]